MQTSHTSFLTTATITRPANTTAYTAGDVIGGDAGTLQVETATAAGTITAAVAQVETATAVGDIVDAGTAEVVVTGAALENSPIAFNVAVAALDAPADWAEKVRVALAANENIDAAYTVSGADAEIILTAKVAAADDATLNISLDNGTCTGITTAASSADTTAGVASGSGDAEVIVAGAALASSPVTLSVAVEEGDTASEWAEKVRDALNEDSRITTYYTVSGATDAIILTAKTAAANDTSLNIALDNDTCTGITPAASSANTTAGSISTANAGSAIREFANAGPVGGRIIITGGDIRIDASSVPSGMTSFRLYLYNESPAAILDNAAWDFASGDRGKLVGYVDLGAPVDLGSTLFAQVTGVNLQVKLNPDVHSLYGVLVTNGAYTPTSGCVHVIRLRSIAA